MEYALIRGINDYPWCADVLGSKVHKSLGSRVHMSLILLNPTPGSKVGCFPETC